MWQLLSQKIDRLFAPVPGWILVLAGIGLLSIAVLVPAYLEARHLNWQRNVMRIQVEHQQQQQQRYRQFLEAVEADEPVVLERLALTHLHLKPTGTVPVGCVLPGKTGQTALVASPYDDVACVRVLREALDDPAASSVDAWLRTPAPQQEIDYEPLPVMRYRMVRIANGPLRYVLASSGLLCMTAGLLPGAHLL